MAIGELGREVLAGFIANVLVRRRQNGQMPAELTAEERTQLELIIAELPTELYPVPATAEAPAWEHRTFRNNPIGPYLVYQGPAILGGILVARGAADVQVIAYDRASTSGVLGDEEIIGVASSIATALNVDGFVNMPIVANDGVVVNISAADALVIVFYVRKP